MVSCFTLGSSILFRCFFSNYLSATSFSLWYGILTGYLGGGLFVTLLYSVSIFAIAFWYPFYLWNTFQRNLNCNSRWRIFKYSMFKSPMSFFSIAKRDTIPKNVDVCVGRFLINIVSVFSGFPNNPNI